MGIRYERKSKDVREIKENETRIRTEQIKLRDEYAQLELIDNLLQDVDDEIRNAILAVKDDGIKMEMSLDDEYKENCAKKSIVADEIDQELEKLSLGLEKINKLDGYGYGKEGLEQGKSVYQEQIDKYKALKQELIDKAQSENGEAVNSVISDNIELINSLYEECSEENLPFISYDNENKFSAIQEEHRQLITSYDEAINAVIEDVMIGSNKTVTTEQAKNYYQSVQLFSSQDHSGDDNDYRRIRSAYNNPNADYEDKAHMEYLDEYLNSAPKWHGEVYRGINIDRKTANKILSDNQVDMLGPASWSSDYDVAQVFARSEGKPVRMIFILSDNKSGASITHISSFNGIESEVTAPSGVIYSIENVEKIKVDGKEFIHVHVKE